MIGILEMIRGRIVAAMAIAADDGAATDVREPVDQMPLPTLDERADFYLRAVYGDRGFTSEDHSRARALILKAMASDIAARSNAHPPEGASLSAQFDEPFTALPNPFLEIAGGRPGDEPSPVDRSARGTGNGISVSISISDHQASDQGADLSEGEGAPSAPLRRSQAFHRRRLPTVFLERRAAKRTAAVCAAAALAAAAVLWLAGMLPTAWFAPNTPAHDTRLAVQDSSPAPSGRSPLVSDRSTMAEAQREVISALNAAQLGPDEIATLLKRGQELIADGKFRLARLVLEQAAEAGSAPAALAVGQTYDPTLRERSATRPDAPPDMAMARAWYQKARELGSAEAVRRLGQLPAPVRAPAAPSNP